MQAKKYITGAGGMFGGGGGGKGGDKSDPNTLRSNATIRIIDLLGEGEIKGLVDGSKSVFLDGTPLMASNGEYNFKGVEWESREGLPDQPHIPSASAVENEENVGVEVKKLIPVTRVVTGEDLDALRVTMRIPALVSRDEDSGALRKTSVSYRILVREEYGTWQNQFGDITISGKCTSPYDRSYLVYLPKPTPETNTWEVRVERITEDSEDDELQNDTVFASYTRITYGKFTYPFSAIVAMTADAQEFGQQVPEREYEVYGRIVQVPSNYDPETRTYTGIWNGTFKWAWTDNPAWVLYDVLSQGRFGLGDYITPEQIDKWSLYEIAQYCDELVPDGRGGTGPRFTFNGVMRSQKEAYDALSEIANAFRGMTYWSSGSVMASQDRPADVSILANPSNVINGSFSYQSSAAKARHTVALVKFRNKDRNYEPDFIVVEDPDGIATYGYNETTIDASVYCTDKAQAYRIGEWTLFTELNETDVVGYSAGLDHAGARPGDIIAIQDPAIAEWDYGGRLATGCTSTLLNLDIPVTFEAGKQYSVSVVLPSGVVEERDIAVAAYGTPTKQITVDGAPFSVEPDAESLWVIASNTLKPSLWRLVSIRESEPSIYEVSAVQHEPAKFNHIDNSANFDPLPTTEARHIDAPANLDVIENHYMHDGVLRTALVFSFSPPSPASMAVAYEVYADTPNGRMLFGRIATNSITITNADLGEYTFYVATVSFDGRISLEASVDYTTEGWIAVAPPTVSSLALVNGSAGQFKGTDIEVSWVNVFDEGAYLPDGTNPLYFRNTVSIYDYDSNDLLRTEQVTGTNYVYSIDKNRADNVAHGRPASRKVRFEVTVTDIYARTSPPAALTTTNPIPDALVATVSSGLGAVTVKWTEPSDPDYVATMVWMIPDGDVFDPDTSPLFDGRASSTLLSGELGQSYDIYLAAYDSFGKDSLNISGPYSVTISNITDEVNEGFEEMKSILFGDGEGSLADVIDSINTNIQRLAATTADSTSYTHSRRVQLETTVADNRALAIQEIGVVATDVSALAMTVTALEAQVGEDLTAALLAEQIARVDGDEALAQQIVQLGAQSEANLAAAILEEQTARADSEQALAESVLETAAQNALGDMAGGLFKVQSVAAPAGVSVRLALLGRVSATATDGSEIFKESGILIDILPDGEGGYRSRVALKTDQFVVTDGNGTNAPFVYEDGMAYIDSAMIRNLTADNITAKSITTDLMKVAGRGIAANHDPYFEDESFWDNPDTAGLEVVTSATAYSGNHILRATGPVDRYYDEVVKRTPINPNKVYSLQIVARRVSGTGTLYGVLHFFDASGNIIASSASLWPSRNGNNHYYPSGAVPDAAWTRYVLQFGAGQTEKMPTNAAYVGVGFLLNYGGGAGDVMELGSFRIVEGVDADLVVKGSIRADHLSVTSLSAITADLGTMTAGVIRSADGKFVIDLNNKTISIEV